MLFKASHTLMGVAIVAFPLKLFNLELPRLLRVCLDANATAGVVLGLGVDGISKPPNMVIT